ncbi:MAG: protein phosphatase 2C domain-containing protein [Anaerolineae bacterium]|jgi:protein phosphatase|nr:protein phosphatase 2C domain-containing protein [Anaerolineae bacterium]
MDILRFFSTIITQLANFLASPFRYLGGTALLAPFRYVRYLWVTLTRSFNIRPQIEGLLRSLQSLGLKVGSQGQRIDFIASFTDSVAEWREARAYAEMEREYAYSLEKGDYSQIHLIHTGTHQRTICHIGTSIGRSENQMVLERATHPPVRLQFTQVNPAQYQSPLLLEYVDGRSRLRLDADEVRQFAPVANGSLLQVDDDEYKIELFAWDKLPPIARLNAGWMTAAGPVRPYNEDAVGIYQHRYGYLFSIADGVGGGEAGETISEFAIKYLQATFRANIRYDLDWATIFQEALTHINRAVRRYARQSEFATAGTTLTAIVVKGWNATICHIGDSRLYHYNGGELRQLTTDHSTSQMVADERPTPDGSPRRPVQRTILDKAIGKRDDITPDTLSLRLQPGDKLLLCSDGLNNLRLAELQQCLDELPVHRVPEQLITLANERFNSDNVSVIAVEVTGKPAPRDSWQATGSPRVFANFDPGWSLKLNAQQKPTTDYGVGTRLSWAVRLALLLLVIALSAAAGLAINRNVTDFTAASTGTAAAAQTALAFQTAVPATLTARPTLPPPTATPTTTPPPTRTPPPTTAPTSTFDPGPTSTLAADTAALPPPVVVFDLSFNG